MTFDPAAAFKEGILLCREDKWREGYDRLIRVAQVWEKRGNLPGLYYSYLGAAMARCEGRKRDAMQLCRRAVSVDPMEPDNYYNLGYLYVSIGNRRLAWKWLQKGLALSPGHPRLAELHELLGRRRPPFLSSLPRKHFLNRIAGWLRAKVSGEKDED
jgi:tetratricopeptide (TPR) repeat protein